MVRGQTVAQPHCQFQRLLVVHCFESSTHAHQYTMTGQRYLLLSDKLLDVHYIYLVTAKHVAEKFPGNTYVMRTNPQPYVRSLEGYEHKDMEMKQINRWYIN